MFDFLNKPYPFSNDLRYSLQLGLGISIGVFLFILFFQPLELSNENIDSYILTIAGFSGITFILFCLLKIILPWGLPGLFRIESWDLKREIFLLFLIWVLNAVAYSFYLSYVGRVPVTMYLGFKIVLISLAVPVAIMLVNEIRNLRALLSAADQNIRELEERCGTDNHENTRLLELVAENRAERLTLDPDLLLLIRSAENYVEIIYRGEDTIQKKLLRSTMKGMEDQLGALPQMVRCHRTCIINTRNVEKMSRTAEGIRLRIKGFEEPVPVSQQYLLSVKSALDGS